MSDHSHDRDCLRLSPSLDKTSLPEHPRRFAHLMHSDIEATGESVVYNPSTDKATVLNPVAAAIWLLCDGTRDQAAICDELEQDLEKRVTRARLCEDLQKVLREFVCEGLLEP
jgi:hypothetical protein